MNLIEATTPRIYRLYLEVPLILLLTTFTFGKAMIGSPNKISSFDSTYSVNIHPTLPSYLVHYHFNAVQGKNGLSTQITVLVYTTIDRKTVDTIKYIIQDLDPLYLKVSPKNTTAPQFVDVNFDGYLDMRLVDFRDDRNNFVYMYYVFDPKQHVFTVNGELSELLSSGAKFDYPNKQFTVTSMTSNLCDGYCWEENTYSVVNNHPILQKQVISELEKYNNSTRRKLTTKKSVSGVMKVVSVEYEDIDDN